MNQNTKINLGINKTFKTTIRLLTCVCALSSVPTIGQSAEYQVTVNTAPLVGNPNAPYYVDFQFNSGGGPFANTATINNFNFGGGSPSSVGSAIVYIGNPSGDLSTGFTLTAVPGATSTSAFNEIAQQSNPGQTLSFDVTLTDNGGVYAPDAFVFGIDDSSTYEIPTTSPPNGTAPDNTGTLTEIDINLAYHFPAFVVDAYSGTGQYSAVNVTVIPVPEPSTAAVGFFALGLGVITLFRRASR